MKKTTQSKQQKIPFEPTLASDASAQFLGYSIQVNRLTARLLRASAGQVVSMEYYGDVSVQENSEVVETTENKNSVVGVNPFSDHSLGLWKSIANWIRGVKAGVYIPDHTTFILSTSEKCVSKLVRQFAAAKTIKDAKNAYDKAKELMWGKSPKFIKQNQVAKTIKEHVDEVFNSDPSIVCKIIKGLELEDDTGDLSTIIRSSFQREIIPPELLDDVITHMLGWVKDKVDTSIHNREAASIPYDLFKTELMSYVRVRDKRTVLTIISRRPSKQEIANELHLTRIYIKQLNLIECDESEKETAVIDYMRASTDRTMWAEAGDVHDSSFDELEQSLLRYWKNTKTTIDIQHNSQTEINRGKLLYCECMKKSFRIQGLDAPDYFCPGCYHVLSEAVRLGWHPKYEKLI